MEEIRKMKPKKEGEERDEESKKYKYVLRTSLTINA